jgi:[ribosomal protein S5]-alanine N-acetyltransferase
MAHRAPSLERAVVETTRLVLRPFMLDDAAFIVELLNSPGWQRWIGDRKVHTIDDAQIYLRNGPIKQQAEYGYALWAVDRRADGTTVGMCGLVRREGLPDADIGYALLPQHERQGYAREAAQATLDFAFRTADLARVLAITDPANAASSRLLESIGLRFERTVQLPKIDGPSSLYAITKP